MRIFYTFMSLAAAFFMATVAHGVTLVEDGQPVAVIVLPAEPSKQEQNAAEDLQTYLAKMSGAVVPIVHEPAPTGNAIMIGRTAFALKHLGDRLTREKLGYEGFVITTLGDRLVLVGMEVPYRVARTFLHSGSGTRHAVFDLLERLGCRFFAFHEDGEHVPQKKTIALEQLDISSKPDFDFRRMHFTIGKYLPANTLAGWKSWSIKNRLGGPHMIMNHNYSSAGTSSTNYSPRIVPDREKIFAKHPEYFALVTDKDGIQRRKIDAQLCLSNPAVLQLAISSAKNYFTTLPDMPAYSLSPNDLHWGWCECDNCAAWDDADPTVGLATRVLQFNNRVAEALAEEFPNRHFLYYAEYTNMPGPPVREDGTIAMQAHSAIIPIYVNLRCMIHGVTDPYCPPNAIHRNRINRWNSVADQIYIYEWWMWSRSSPIPMQDIIGQKIKYYHKHGIRGYYAELLGHSPDNTLSMYIASKMLWDSQQDPNAILNDFLKCYFQESAGPMRQYYRVLGSDLAGPKSHGARFLSRRPNTRSNIDLPVDMHRAKELGEILDSAIALAKAPIVKRRLARESKAVSQYELDANIELLFSQYEAKPTPDNAQAILVAIDKANAHYETVTEIVTYRGRKHWQGYITKTLSN